MPNLSLFSLRQARADDGPSIRRLIRKVGINPTNLDWHRFIVGVDNDDQVIGCGQVKSHRDGSFELASVAVEPEYRLQRVARSIITRLLEIYPRPLYLTCRSELTGFYKKFSFQTITQEDFPQYFQRIFMLVGWLKSIHLLSVDIVVMRLDN